MEGTKCNLEFTTNGISEEEYQKQLRIGIEYRRSNYREKDITSLYNSGALYDQIGNCTFGDVYVGDYFTTDKQAPDGTNHKVTWLIADLNNYLHTGITEVTSNKYPKQEGGGLMICHATIIPATILGTAKMNDANTTGVVDPDLQITDKENKTRTNVGAYVGSKMKQNTLPSILREYIKPVFGEHIITYTNMLADQMDPNRYNQYGSDNMKGASSSLADVGIDNRQYAIFQLKPEFINSYGTSRFGYWLKAVTDSLSFASVSSDGIANTFNASGSFGVRPRFLIN